MYFNSGYKNIMRLITTLSIAVLLLFNSCSNDGEKLNLFSIEDDKKLGAQLNSHILSDSSGLEVLDTATFREAYAHINRIKNNILRSGKVKHKDDFSWEVKIIRNDTMLNAFATPGGYIYVFTGLIKYLDTEDELAGVLAHEIAHADRRHSTAMLTKVYGISFLMSLILGNENQTVRGITENLLSLSFSRGSEEEADKYSVLYLCHDESHYRADGAAGFFEKLMKENKSGNMPEFLSTHPNPPNRITNIKELALTQKCDTISSHSQSYTDFQKALR